MSDYERCQDHGLMRCAMCDRPKEAAPIQERIVKPIQIDPNTLAVLEEVEIKYPKAHSIVAAAQDYSLAQVHVEQAQRNVERLRLELQQAENAAKDAAADRDVKKQVLQKLVSE